METDSFQSTKLGHLDFEADENRVSNIPLPDEMPRMRDLSHVPKDILKSSTVENLISQNEDLMARLKVSLRRLSILETENQKITEESQRTRLSQSAIADQLMVWKEKDSMWKQKIDQLEREKEIHAEKSHALAKKVEVMTAELTRHMKYHERIKTQVKPYISELKAYSKTQELKVAQLEKASAHRDSLLSDLRHQIIEVTKNSRFQVETSEKKSQDLVQFYETQVQDLQTQVERMHAIQEELEMKSLKLHTALERQDTLENENVTLRRTKEDLKIRLERDLAAQKERMSELSRQNQKLGVEHADLQVRVVEDQERLQQIEKDNYQLQEQLESLRYMWNAKNEENERLKMAAASLERINLELSQKLNELRK